MIVPRKSGQKRDGFFQNPMKFRKNWYPKSMLSCMTVCARERKLIKKIALEERSLASQLAPESITKSKSCVFVGLGDAL